MSSREDLTLFSYETLALVGRGGAGAHDLLRMAKVGRFLAWAGESQYYVEPKRLAKLGYLEARKEPGKTRERTVYTLTDKGLEALRDWARTPVGFTPFKSEALIRILATDLVGEEAVCEGFGPLREDLEDMRRRMRESAERARALPHREKYLGMGLDFVEGLIRLYEDLVDKVERDFAGS
ncbi:MAG TPA: PadR family transcriptional regulator [Gaiellaceae bacterium]|nr:PadR family transcriptional regulator [Gaiellaceae bacterium]